MKLGDIDPILFQKSYFLEPDDLCAKPFALLRQALEETAKVAFGKQHPGTSRPGQACRT